MISCDKCDKIFKSERGLKYHKNKDLNCINKCNICLKTYSNKQSLKRHEYIVCKKRYECEKCSVIFNTKNKYNKHNEICNNNVQIKDVNDQNDQLNKIIQNIPNDKQININIINNNNITITNSKINSDNKKVRIKNNFMNTNPANFHFGYIGADEHKELAMIDSFDENIADMFMYEEERFRDLPKDIIYKYEKESLTTKGMEMLFSRLQENPKNRNTRIKKSKSGKCYIYDKEWIEEKLQKIVTKICCNLCDYLYDKETSLNHFVRLIIADQPRRLSELRKHIETEITDLNKIEEIEENKMIEH